MSALDSIFSVAAAIARFLIVFGLAVVVHEFGHMIVAKWCGARVDVFSVGFGRKLLSKKWGETEYQIAAFPLGGYVKIAGMDPGDELTGAPWEFLSISAWKRILILVAGPAMNVVLAFALYYLLFVAVGESITRTTTVGVVPDGSPGWEIGLHPGDTILAVGDTEVKLWEDIERAVYEAPGPVFEFTLKRGEETLVKSYEISLVALATDSQAEDTPPVEAGEENEEEEPAAAEAAERPEADGFLVNSVQPGGAAERAGLVAQAIICTIDGRLASEFDDLRMAVSGAVKIGDDGTAEAIPLQIGWVDPAGVEHESQLMPDVFLPAEDAQPYHAVARLGLTYDPGTGVEDFFLKHLPLLNVAPKLEPIVGVVKEQSPAAKAGIRKGDRILSVDNAPLEDWNRLQSQILKQYTLDGEEVTGVPMTLSWRNADGEVLTDTIVPAVTMETLPTDHGIRTGERVPFADIGIQRLTDRRRYGVIGAIPLAAGRVQRTFTTMLGLLGRLVSGNASAKVFGGPIAIFKLSAETGRWGLEKFLGFIAMLSASLALLNILPVPALDGGHVVLYIYEMIRRKPLTLKQMEAWGRIGIFFFLIPLMIFLIYNDLDREGVIGSIGSSIRSLFQGSG